MEHAGIDNSEASVKTVTRFLNEKGYYYLQARKKGLLKRDDLKTISLTETLILCFRQQTKEILAFGYKTVTHPKTQRLQKVQCRGLIRRC